MADEDVLNQPEGEATDVDTADEPQLQEQLKEKINVQVEEVGPLRRKLTVAVPRDFVDERLNDQYAELRRDAAVPGFRKGRAPRRLLEKRFGNEVSETLVQQLVSSGFMAAVEKTDLKVIGDPMVWVRKSDSETPTLVDVQEAIEQIKLPSEGDLEFSCEVEIRPEFELPELDNIPLKRPTITITDADVDQQVDRYRAMHGTFEAPEDGIVQKDDILTVDLRMTSGGTELKKEENVRLAARPQLIDGVRLENLGEVLAGAKIGETRTATGTISDDYIKEEFRGKPAEFEIKIREIQRLRLPELNDELAKRLGFEDVAEMRAYVRDNLELGRNEQVRRALAAQVYDYLLSKTNFDVPERLSERQASRLIVRRMLDLYRQGLPPTEVEKHLDELRAGAQADSVRDLKLFFIMEKLAEKIEVDIQEAEINARIAAIAQHQGRRFDRVRDELARDNGLVNIYMQIRDDKIVDQLISKASITDVTPEEAAAETKASGKSSGGKSSAKTAQGSAEGGETAKKPRRTPPKKKAEGEADAT